MGHWWHGASREIIVRMRVHWRSRHYASWALVCCLSVLHRCQADLADAVELKEPKAWEGLFGAREGWSGGIGSDAELYG